ncbi:MAG: hypothetical protein RLZZ299_1142 [Pseudomonadota bacterium]
MANPGMSRRALLGSLAAVAAGGVLRPARAAVASPADRKFVFVWAYGGWDPTVALAPLHAAPAVACQPGSEPATSGDHAWTHHPDRPAVDAFFARYGAQAAVLHGITMASVGHDTCLKLAYTGDTTGTSPDWGVRLAAAAADRYALPQVVARGPQFPGQHGALVTRIGTSGRVESLLRGALLASGLDGVPVPSRGTQSALDALVASRSAFRREGARGARQAALFDAHASSVAGAHRLEEVVGDVRWGEDSALSTQVDLALDLIRLDLSRCVTLAYERLETWDSHADNFRKQGENQQALFQGLLRLLDGLAALPGHRAARALDETVVVVASEMGRTPQLNGGEGKDHWGVTSVLLIGAGVRGGRSFGGYTPHMYGATLDFATGEPDAEGRTPVGADLGATLLSLGGLDPGEVRTGRPISGMLV